MGRGRGIYGVEGSVVNEMLRGSCYQLNITGVMPLINYYEGRAIN